MLHDGVYPFGALDILSLPLSCSVTSKNWSRSHVKVEAVSILPRLKIPQRSAEVRRVKLSTTPDTSNKTIRGILELINDEGARVRLESELPIIQGVMDDSLRLAHLGCLKDLDVCSAETLCMEGSELWDGDAPAGGSVEEVRVVWGISQR